MVYAAQGSPTLDLQDITEYPIRKDWPALFAQSCVHGDDGHVSKFVRAVAHAGVVCRPYEVEAREGGFRVSGDMWLKIGNMSKLIF